MNPEVLEYLKEIERTTGMHFCVSADVSKADIEEALKIMLQRYSAKNKKPRPVRPTPNGIIDANATPSSLAR